MGGCPDSGSLLLARLALSLSRPFACRLRLILGFLLTGGLRLWRGRRLRRFFSSLRALLTRVSPSATRCRRSPKIAAARLEAPRLVHGHTSETATHTHGHRQTDTHTHQHINAQRDSWPWKYSCSRLHLSSCTSRIYPGSPSSAPGFSWAYIWFGHLGIVV